MAARTGIFFNPQLRKSILFENCIFRSNGTKSGGKASVDPSLTRFSYNSQIIAEFHRISPRISPRNFFSQLNLARSRPATPTPSKSRLNLAEKYLHGRDPFHTAYVVDYAEINIHLRELYKVH